jgi:uncharacterized membrane protein
MNGRTAGDGPEPAQASAGTHAETSTLSGADDVRSVGTTPTIEPIEPVGGSAGPAGRIEPLPGRSHRRTTDNPSASPRAVARTRPRAAPRRRVENGPWLITAGAFVLYTLLSVLRYERRETMSWDLGIFTEAVKQYAHFHAPVVEIRGHDLNLLGDHFHPILALLAPFFWVFPSPVTLLVGQAFLLAVAAVPITRTAMDLVGRRPGYAIGAAYGLSWGIVQTANFDFHEVAFAVPLLAFSLCSYIRGTDHDVKTICWALPLLLVKEDIALLVPLIVALVIARRRFAGRPAVQASVIAVGVASGVMLLELLVKVVIPHFNPQNSYFYWADGGCLNPDLHNSVGKLMTCVPSQVMDGVGEKLRTIALTLVPVAFVAARSPLALLAVPALVARFTNVHENYWGTDYHYSAVPMVIVFVAAVDGLARMRADRAAHDGAPAVGAGAQPRTWLRQMGDAQLKHGAVAMLAIAGALTQSFPLQDLWRSEIWQPAERAAALKAAERTVPDDVTVETTIDMLAPLAARAEAMWIGNPNTVGAPPQYIAFNVGKNDWNGTDTPLAYAEQRHPGVRYVQVFADPRFDLYVFRQAA